MKTLLAILVLDLVPELYLAPLITFGGLALFFEHYKDVKTEEALIDSYDIYIKDYTELNPEWKWGNHQNFLNYQELLGVTLEGLQKDVFANTLIKTNKDNIPNTDYTLRLYFLENVCVRAEYVRPMNKSFLGCYNHGEDCHFHVYSELLGDEYPIDLNIRYHDSFGLIVINESQMLISVGFCADKFPYVSSVKCLCK